MKIFKAFRFKLKTNEIQQTIMSNFAGRAVLVCGASFGGGGLDVSKSA